ncbi:alpha/beta fold hydrolase [Ornithinimicrobium cavernae]|uniref:alpha/beta fold hydrolase n=1 Tax=Ornithinimicrobium cavernae TaxID=2666047 RepID=UPI001F28FDC4|nr:alpha/beta hydrolase [Ornithinimicrobium cavernae]
MGMDTRTLQTDGAEITYDVHGLLPTTDGSPPLMMVGQPMEASGFYALASHFPERTVVTYDPRGLGRSIRTDGLVTQSATVQAGDLHAVIQELGAGPVDLFASSGGAITALALVTAHPDDVRTLVAHEPPLNFVLPDAAAAQRASDEVQALYQAKGWGHGMAAFVAMTMWQGEFTDDYFAQPPPDPAQFGMPTEDDGARDDPLLSARSDEVGEFRPDPQVIGAAPTRVLIAVGEESLGMLTGRMARHTAELLGQEPTVFPSHHGGFSAEDGPWPGQAGAFAVRLREVLGEEG